jgi:hypothetical protein
VRDGQEFVQTVFAAAAQPGYNSRYAEQKARHIAIIETRYSEVRLDPNRETYGHGQGSGLSGEAESRVAGFRFAPLAAAN